MALLSSSEGGDTVNHAGLADAELRNIEYKTIPADPWKTKVKMDATVTNIVIIWEI